MNDVVSTFPLLRLPINAILNTLRIMNLKQIFGISLLSKKTKNLVESSKLITSIFRVTVANTFRVTLLFANYSMLWFNLYQVRENEPLQELGTPGTILIRSEDSNVTWPNTLSVKQLLEHLQSIFHHSKTTLLFEGNCERFSVESIHRNVKNVERIKLTTGNHENNRKALRLFQSASIDLGDNALVNERIPKDILIQNIDSIHANNVQNTLDDLLMTNARSIHLSFNQLSTKTINQFLKLWTKGSNSRLEYMFLRFNDNSSLEELFSGLKYKDAPERRTRYFKTASFETSERVTEGWDIWRNDGTEATVTAFEYGDSIYFQLFVWHDHCLVG